MIVTDDSDLQRTLRLVRSHGRDPDRVYRRWGFNLRMPTMSAALGLSQEAKLDEMIQRRREMAAFLNEALGEIQGIEVPTSAPEREPVYQTYNIRLTSADLQSPLQDYLAERGIPTRVTYDPVHLNNYYQSVYGCSSGQLPVTEDISERILTLPFHLDLDDEDLSYVAETVRAFFVDRDHP